MISEMTDLPPESALAHFELMSTTEMHVQGGHGQVRFVSGSCERLKVCRDFWAHPRCTLLENFDFVLPLLRNQKPISLAEAI